MRVVLWLMLAAAVQGQTFGVDGAVQAAARIQAALAREALDRQMRSAAEEAVEELARLHPKAAELASLRGRLSAMTRDVPATPAFEERRRRDRAEIARRLGAASLAAARARAPARARELFALRPRESPAGPLERGLRTELARALVAVDAPEEARAILQLAVEDDAAACAEGAYDSAIADLARIDVALVSSPGHPEAGFLTLPKGPAPQGGFPLLVAVEGAGCGFLAAARNFRAARADRPWAILVPVTLSNTNALEPAHYPMYGADLLETHAARRIAFDESGLANLVQSLATRFGTRPRFAMTGFSGGGILVWWWIFQRPDTLQAAVLAGGNFGGAGAAGAGTPREGGPPILILIGEKDPHREHVFGQRPGLEGQAGRAIAALRELGFSEPRRSLLPDRGHEAMADQVFRFLDEVRAHER
jgi:poly(3-hydroxybutyrate) depolymerase